MITGRDLLLGFLLPGLASAGIVWITARRFGCAVALTAGYLIGHTAIGGWPGWPPPTTEQWLPYLAILALFADRLEHWKQNAPLQWGARLVLLIILLGLTFRPLIQYSWQLGQTCVWSAGITASLAGLWWSSRRCAANQTSLATHAAWTMIVGATALACAMGGSQKLGQFGGALVAPLIAFLMLRVWKTEIHLSRGGFPVLILIWAGLLLNGFFYASVPWWASLLIGISPLGLWARNLLRSTSPITRWKEAVLELSGVGILLLGALVPMTLRFVRAMNAESGVEDYNY